MNETIRVAVLGSRELFRDGALELIRSLASTEADARHAQGSNSAEPYGEDSLGVVVLAVGARSILGPLEEVERGVAAIPIAPSSSVPEIDSTPVVLLTPREIGVLGALARNGETNRELAEDLEISEATVKRHLATIFSKLGVHTRMQAVRRAEALGYLTR